MSNQQNIKIEELFEGLKLSQTLAADILDILKEENKAIQKMATQSLIRITKQKEDLLEKTYYLDNKISTMVSQYMSSVSRQVKSTPGGVSPQISKGKKITDLVPILSPEQGQIIQQYYKNLTKFRQEIFTRNMINKRFIKDTLQYINDAISLITDQPPKNRLYCNKGRADYGNQKATMISREV